MKLISLKKITDNMILAKNIHAREGNVLLAKGAPLKESYAKRLLEWGIASVYIEDDRGELVEIDEDLYQKAEDDALQVVNEFLADLNNEQLPESIRESIIEIVKKVLQDKNVLQNLVEIEAYGEELFKHCITVSVLSVIIGSFAGYSTNKLWELATGSILIDLGKIESPNRLDETKTISDKELLELEQHPRLGFEKLLKFKGKYQNSAQVILQHHEKYDGSGYPQGLKGDQIHEYARITAIADIYNSTRLYENNNQVSAPEQIIERIINNSGLTFDPEFTRLFSQKVAPIIVQNNNLDTIDHTAVTDGSHHPEGVKKDPNIGIKESRWITPPASAIKESDNVPDSVTNELSGELPKSKEPSGNQFFAKLQKLTGLAAGNKVKPGKVHDANHESQLKKQPTPARDSNKINPVKEESLTKKQTLAKKQSSNTINELNRIRFEITPERLAKAKSDALSIIARSFAKISTKLFSEKARETIRRTIDNLMADNDILSHLVTIQALNDNTFSHCVSVSLLSVMTGVSLGYNDEQLRELGTGALLVDLGKVELCKQYLVRAQPVGNLEYQVMMPEHTQLGFERLWELKRNTGVPYIALQHHERFDGSGFPAGLKGPQINELARVVALADTYETLISEGINGQKLMPHEVIEYIRDFSGSHFDPDLSKVFLQNVTPFLIGSNVLLNNGEKAKVVSINKDLLARPVVRVMIDKDGKKLDKPIVKELEKDLTLFIVSALKDEEF